MTTKTIATIAAVLALTSVPALAQQPKSSQPSASVNCGMQGNTPPLVEGQVVKVDRSGGNVTVRGKDGTTHEFKASADTLADMKPGDRIEARLRPAQNC